MPLRPPAPRYVAELFAPLHRELIALLRGLTPEQWKLPTVAGAWRVRDVAAHLLDGMLRRLSMARGRGASAMSYEQIVTMINELNASGVAYWQRHSTAVITDLLEIAGARAAAYFESLDPHAPATIGVAWAGEAESENWMDTGREYTEWWHHQMQIRDAVGAPPLLVARWLAPLLDFSVRALPRAYA
ncbi:MAG TPA: maleylpyruvate isomerase N-terminal domain-containing protein, partial [Thermoanaerobaculia bacterium]|nr:maleylpyruvate isomerase N-terminal domain-containing protein [Thermoanaerobaculia bacterium]